MSAASATTVAAEPSAAPATTQAVDPAAAAGHDRPAAASVPAPAADGFDAHAAAETIRPATTAAGSAGTPGPAPAPDANQVASAIPASDQARLQNTLERFIALSRRVDVAGRALPATGDPFFDVVAMVAEAIGVRLRTSAQDLAAADVESKLTAYGHISGFRFRRVDLDGSWWTDAAVPLLAFGRENGEPLALIPLGTRYGAHGAGAPPRLIDRQTAEKVATSAYILYPSLPERVDPRALFRLALRGSRRDVFGILVGAAGAALLGIAGPIVLGQLVATVIPEQRGDLLVELVTVTAAATLGAAMLEAYKTLAITHLTGRADLRLQTSLWDRVLRLRSTFFETYQTGDIAMRVIGIDTIRRILSSTMLGAMLGGLFSVIYLLVMLAYDAGLAGWATLYALVLGGAFSALAFAQIRLQRRSLDLRGRIQALIVQLVNAIPKLRSNGVERRAFVRWADIFLDQRRADTRSLSYRADASVVQNLMVPVASFGLLALFELPPGTSRSADFIAFNAAFGLFLAAVVGMFSAATSALTVVPVWERIKPILAAPVEAVEERDDPGVLTGAISVARVRFGYAKDAPPILRDISFDVAPGEFVALVGPSGCGKSTLVRLLLGFLEPDAGAILYNGRDLSKLDIRRVRQQIGTVLQAASLLPGSIFDNVAGAGNYKEADVMDALTLAGLADEVRALPMGLHTVVTEGRSTFSGGQRQRLMIARALIKRPKILFFDEATSALDNKTQLMVSNAIEALAVTRIVIAHRLSTIRKADRILVVKDGAIAECGRFDELMAQKGFFYTLAERQIA